jgi:hypothetical protein
VIESDAPADGQALVKRGCGLVLLDAGPGLVPLGGGLPPVPEPGGEDGDDRELCRVAPS